MGQYTAKNQGKLDICVLGQVRVGLLMAVALANNTTAVHCCGVHAIGLCSRYAHKSYQIGLYSNRPIGHSMRATKYDFTQKPANTVHNGGTPSSSDRPPNTGPLSSLSLSLPSTCASRTDLDLPLASAHHKQRTISHIMMAWGRPTHD